MLHSDRPTRTGRGRPGVDGPEATGPGRPFPAARGCEPSGPGEFSGPSGPSGSLVGPPVPVPLPWQESRTRAAEPGAGKKPDQIAHQMPQQVPPGAVDRSGDAGGRFLSRRTLLTLAGVATAGVPLAACGGSGSGSKANRVIRIGYVSPQTGALSAFGAADRYVTDTIRAFFDRQGGMTIGARTYPVEIIVRDSQSDQNRAAQAAGDLIYTDRVDIILVASTPETTNPVSDQCEANEMPCISTAAPWQSWFNGRGGDPARPFKWTYHFFWGLEDVTRVYRNMWGQLPSNKKVGALWPDDSDGRTFADGTIGFPPVIATAGYTLVKPPVFPTGTSDFGPQLRVFKQAGVDILTGVLTPGDFQIFWKQAVSMDFSPKIVTVAKGLLFPRSVQALGQDGNNLGTEVWWSPYHRFKSSLTGATPETLAKDFTDRTGTPWVQTLGFVHALYELATEALAQVGSPDDRAGLAAAIGKLRTNTIVGEIGFGGSADIPKNVAKTPLVGGQWRTEGTGYSLVIVGDDSIKNIAVQPGRLLPYTRAVQGT
ncbi:ABC-type branched-chain amino acid transport systems periplasmic component-like protein [Candidatus Protofrankia datiscae]|uniref:ABC-type branched-chain amino acid transport systems periplasmic component-like protein n=2 Tax=Frankiaceae TaxID=74712 RepID=F8AUX7_9ACTN|nr:ABC-type branched-chain amino acid transport systems periplasmic component-like protein [Candidatus Protofrankia datiscae]